MIAFGKDGSLREGWMGWILSGWMNSLTGMEEGRREKGQKAEKLRRTEV